MLRSIKTSAGRHLIANSTASQPDLPEIVSKPYRSKIHASHARYSALSSTTKIKVFLITKSSRVLNCYEPTVVDAYCVLSLRSPKLQSNKSTSKESETRKRSQAGRQTRERGRSVPRSRFVMRKCVGAEQGRSRSKLRKECNR